MSEHHFLVTTGRKIPNDVRETIEMICAKHGATFVQIKDGDTWKSWASCRNHGEPCNGATASAVREDIAKADLSEWVD